MPISAVPTDSRGFSLLEVLMALAVLGVVSLLFAILWQGSFRIAELQSADTTLLRDRENVLARHFAGETETPAIRLLPTPLP